MKNFYRILQYKKLVIAVFCIAIISIIYLHFTTTVKSENNFVINDGKNNYKHELVILNKSFRRDLLRSMNLYKSFEKYFLQAKETPFFIVVPLADLELFEQSFKDSKSKREIDKLPEFITEQEVLKVCNEPNITYDGAYTMQVCKLCFGTLGIAKNYLSIDSDSYFTKPFDVKMLFDNQDLKTFAWRPSKKQIKKMQTAPLYLCPGSCIGHVTKCVANAPCMEDGNNYLNYLIIKDFWGNRKQEMYGFVHSFVYINSEAINGMKEMMKKKGYNSFAKLIRIVPFEMQWYGEYVLQHRKFIPSENELFTVIDDANLCYDEDGGKNKYGITLQSMIYNYGNDKPIGHRNNNHLIYKRPAFCQ